MASFESPVSVGFDGAFLEVAEGTGSKGSAGEGGGTDAPVQPLAWVARDGSKPRRPREAGPDGAIEDAWVLHAGPDWSGARLSSSPEEVAAELLGAFEAAFGPLPPVRFQRAHLWRYARPTGPSGPEALYDSERGIGVCGDALSGGRVEGALLSGRAVAGRILEEAPGQPGNPLGEGRPAPRIQFALGL
jgi:predicted NAD/FAD-dependent oxidoreductase